MRSFRGRFVSQREMIIRMIQRSPVLQEEQLNSKMDALLDRLWELANEEDDPGTARRNERITEARALWSALDVWLTSVKPQELCVGDGTFTKTLACIRSVLSDPNYWAIGSDSFEGRKDRKDGNATVLANVNRVLVKVANRGERERETLVRDGVADLLVGCVEPRQQQSSPLTATDAAAILQTLHILAADARNRASLQISQTIRVCLTLMQIHALELVVQLRGCQFLQQMALEEECKERIGRLGGLQVIISALTRFPEEAQLVASALDLLFFLCIELEHHEDPLQYRDANSATLEAIVKAVVNAMLLLQSVELVQSNGIAVLNRCAERYPSQLEPMGSKHQSLKTVTTPSAASKLDCDTRKWPLQYETSSKDSQRAPKSSRGLDEKYQIVLRRSQEQTKLLSLQNARLASHTSEHQQVLRRMHSLETALEAADRRYQVEYALRLAETAQCEQLSLALNESRRETKALTAQQSSAARELQQKESMRTEYMMRTRESKQDKQRVETQRDTALLQIESFKYEKLELLHQLAECRREGLEALCMREEDVDTRRPGVFSELAKAATAHDSSRSSRSTLERSRRNSLPSEAFAVHPIEHLSSSASSSSLSNGPTKMFPSRTRGSGGDSDLNDDPDSIGTHEIQSCLVSVFQSLDTSLEGTSDDGVHVSTVRRFFLESGLVQPPTVQPADVDVVLARVLAQSQANRKTRVIRKDFSSTWAPPHGWVKAKKKPTLTRSASLNNDVKRFRFFDQDAFNEAVTLVGMRRFPRTDLLRVLQTVVALYLRPYLRQQRSLTLPTASQSRRSSTSSASASSPSLVCNRAMRAILNGLALHLGHGNDRERLHTSGVDEGETRYHLNAPDTLKRRHQRENVVFSMLEMLGVLSREQRPLGTICEFYSGQHLPNAAAAAAISAAKDELFGLSFELLLSFAMDFELIPAFMDRISLKHLHSEVAGLLKAYFALHGKDPPSGADAETLKKVALSMILARLAIELFSTKTDYETPERQITGLLQWLDNSAGREKIMRKSGLPLVIRFSRQLYAVKT
ncbi:hypothetical protein BBJ28_00009722 [Nothophytophthora sp. Chile5]|nr:hypothetical protein BBJ28_00009722 [Nothophytophthora sp. Chile5]